jgi:hypothetical protein
LKTWKLPDLNQDEMKALVETLAVMTIARTETASRSDAGYEHAMRFNRLLNTLDNVIQEYYDDVENAPKIPVI